MKKILLLFILALILSGCSQINKSENNTEEKVNKATLEDNNGNSGAEKEFTIMAKKWTFDPVVITVNQGDKVKLNIKSIDVAHGIVISEFNVDERLEPGKIINIEFTANKTGEFDFFCNVFCGEGHKDMKGKLIVE
ncbi:cytochrome c oxidase subunit II [Candidatus Falkowbacteria bacterium CG_4_9_14_3_um_filter_36_9]|nr:MAG: cytochrome c oxidase subunit II [Candidatus Falkowbacteria bacterium CG_4_9_14_3_um_filter_36_9]